MDINFIYFQSVQNIVVDFVNIKGIKMKKDGLSFEVGYYYQIELEGEVFFCLLFEVFEKGKLRILISDKLKNLERLNI